ncbi:MAG: hypothetical protein MZV63_07305 [Marinilabiliales bacterium]|nr:hypothetical protein [Marinilabiliales bacterium]
MGKKHLGTLVVVFVILLMIPALAVGQGRTLQGPANPNGYRSPEDHPEGPTILSRWHAPRFSWMPFPDFRWT